MMWRKITDRLASKALVLMYHRVAQLRTDPWQLAVSVANFEEQLQVLQASYKVVSLQELMDQLARRSVSSGSICITFDDGYADNYLYAKPLLEQYRCPANFFLPARFISSNQQFWWDELEAILLTKTFLPSALTLHINNKPYTFHVGNEGELTPEQLHLHAAWTWPNQPPTQRCATYLAIWEEIRPLPLEQIEAVMHQIRNWAASESLFARQDVPMTAEEVRDMLRNPLFSIGIHTSTHPDLAAHPRDIQQHEITGCASSLQTNFGAHIQAIAYPYGKFNSDTLSIAKELGLTAFTTQEKFITKQSDPQQLGRFHVKNWNGKDFDRQLRTWSKKLW